MDAGQRSRIVWEPGLSWNSTKQRLGKSTTTLAMDTIPQIKPPAVSART